MRRDRSLWLGLAVCLCGAWAVAQEEVSVPPFSLAETDGGAVVPAQEMPAAAPVKQADSEVLADAKEKGAPAPASATLAGLIDEALRNNNDIQAGREDREINLGRSHFERRNYFPRLLGNTHYETQPDKDNNVRKDTNSQSDRYYRYGYGVFMDQMLWDFGETRGQVHQAYHEARSTEEAVELRKADVAYDVTEAYWRAVMFQKMVEHRQKSLDALKRNAQAVADQVEAKAAFPADHKNALSAVTKAEHNLMKAQNGLAVAKRRLLHLLGRDVDGDIALADDLTFASAMTVPVLNVEVHPDMKRVRALQDAADSARRSAKAMLFPRLYFRGMWDFQRPEDNPGEAVTNYGPEGYYYQLMLNVKIPIGWEWVAGRGKLREAEAKQRQLTHQARALSEGIKYRVADARYGLEEAMKGLDVAQKRYDAAKAALDLKKELQGAKKATQGDVAMAEDEFEQAEIGRFQAIYDVKCAEAHLLHALGQIAGR